MTDTLGHLVWWRVTEPLNLDHATLSRVLASVGIPAPRKAIPIDVFRRLTSNTRKTYALDEGSTLECTLAIVQSGNDKTLNRHMVGTVRDGGGATKNIMKIGDVAFYKPPRGQHSKARLRVVSAIGPFGAQAADFAACLRSEYESAVRGAVDTQAIRRIVRAHLAEQGAVYLDGPYFVTARCEALEALFEAIGGGSFMHTVPLVDSPAQREFVARFTDTEEVAS